MRRAALPAVLAAVKVVERLIGPVLNRLIGRRRWRLRAETA